MIYTIAHSVQGAAHIRADLPCQDFHVVTKTPDYLTLAVADGHGSSACPFSAEGAELATKIFGDLMSCYYDKNNLEQLAAFFSRDGKNVIPKEIERSWKEQVINRHRQRERNFPNEIDNRAIFKQYGTTLLGLFITENFIYAFRLGDGDIICVTDENISPVLESDYLLGVETFSLSSTDAWRNADSAIFQRSPNHSPCLYMLATDGFSNSHASQEDFYQTCRDYYKLLADHELYSVQKNLEQWLQETSREGCGDDISLVLAFDEL